MARWPNLVNFFTSVHNEKVLNTYILSYFSISMLRKSICFIKHNGLFKKVYSSGVQPGFLFVLHRVDEVEDVISRIVVGSNIAKMLHIGGFVCKSGVLSHIHKFIPELL